MYRNPVADINDLEDRIAAAVATVDADMLQHTWIELGTFWTLYVLRVPLMLNGCSVQNKP